MTITAAALAGGNNGNNTTSVSRSMGSVTAGQLVVVWGMRFSPSNDRYQQSDCTQLAGTAALTPFVMHRQDGGWDGEFYSDSAIWSAIVTTSGTLTVQTAGAPSASYLLIAAEAFNGSWDAERFVAHAGQLLPTNTTSSSSTGPATAQHAALFCAALQLDATGATAFTADGNFTLVYENETATDDNGSAIYRITSSGLTDAGDWTHGTTHWGVSATLAIFREAIAAGTGGGLVVGSGASWVGSSYVGASDAADGAGAALTQVAGTGATGVLAPATDKALTQVSGTGAVGTLSALVEYSAALTQVAGTGAVGALAPATDKALTQVSGTGAVGALAPAIDKALTQVSGTGAVGTLAPLVSYGAELTQVSGTGAVGTLAPATDKALAQVSGAGAVGTLAPATDKALTQVSGTGAVGTLAPATDKALTQVSGAGAGGALVPELILQLTGVAGVGATGTLTPSLTIGLTEVEGTGVVGALTAVVGGDMTVALTGVAGVGEVGTLAPATDRALTQVSGTGEVGTLSALVEYFAALTQVSGTGAVGTLSPAAAIVLAQVAASGAVGDLTFVSPDLTLALTGVSGLGAVGDLTFVASDITVALTGVAGLGTVGTLAPTGGDAYVNPMIFGPGGTAAQRKKAKPAYNAHTNVVSALEIPTLAPPIEVVAAPVQPANDDEDVFVMIACLVAQGVFDAYA